MFTATEYNLLPTVDVADRHAEHLIHLRNKLTDLILEHNLENIFGVRLVHHHFPMKDTEVAVFQPTNVDNLPDIMIMGPLPASDVSKFFPKNYVAKDGKLVPYEYITMAGPNVTDYPAFAAAFANAIIDADATNVFGLSTIVNSSNPYQEFEIPDLRYTVMVAPNILPPPKDGCKDISTDWTATPSITMRGHCRRTHASGHVGVSTHCRRTTTVGHVPVSKANDEDSAGLPLGKIVNHVYSLVSAVA